MRENAGRCKILYGVAARHGQRTLNRWYTKDLREVAEIPASNSSPHGDAVFIFLLFEKAEAESFQPRKIVGGIPIADS